MSNTLAPIENKRCFIVSKDALSRITSLGNTSEASNVAITADARRGPPELLYRSLFLQCSRGSDEHSKLIE